MFPDTVWDGPARPLGPVRLYTAGLPVGLADRFTDDLGDAVGPIAAELDGLAGVEVCLFADRLPLDAQALGWPEGQQLRAISFGAERVLVLSAWNTLLVRRAGTFGLAHQAEWGLSGGDYPDPLGATVGHWYVSRLEGRVRRDHDSMRFAKLIRALPEEISWTASRIPERLLWNPEFQLSPIGDFAGFAVTAEGLDVIRNPDAATVRRLGAEWQSALLAEATGSESGTRGWIVGTVIVAGVLSLGALIAFVNLWSARRERANASERLTVPVVDDEQQPVDQR